MRELTAEARVRTERPHRYLAQLRDHVTRLSERRGHRPRMHSPPEIRHAEWSDDHGVVTLSLGRWTMHATPGALTLRVTATGEDELRRLQELVRQRVETIGRRDGLTVDWQNSVERPRRWSHAAGWVAVVMAAVAVAAHLTLGGAALAVSGWAAVGLVAAVILVKVVVLRLVIRRRRRRTC